MFSTWCNSFCLALILTNCLVIDHLMFSFFYYLAAEMLNMEEFCLRKPSKSRKPVRAEKKKTKKEDPVPEPDTVEVAEPASPKVRRTPRKKDAKKSQGIIILEGQGAPEAKRLPSIAADDKGKGVLHEPSPLSKRHKPNPLFEPVQPASTGGLKTIFADLNLRLEMEDVVGPLGIATASTALSRITHTANNLGSGVWNKLKVEDEMKLLDCGIHSSVMVRALFILGHYSEFTPTILIYYLFLQSIFNLLRHHQTMVRREEVLKKELAKWNEALKISTS